MTVNLEALAASALMSFIVTVVIEYIAKPRLEARKEEILDAHRSRRELLAATVRIAYAATVVATEVPGSADSAVRGNVYVEQDRQYERLQGEVQRLVDDMGRHAGTFLGPMLTVVVDYTSSLQGLLMSARPRPEQAAEIRDLAAAMAGALSSPRLWRVRRQISRVHALTEVRRLVALHSGSGG